MKFISCPPPVFHAWQRTGLPESMVAWHSSVLTGDPMKGCVLITYFLHWGRNFCPRIMSMAKHMTPNTGQMRLTVVIRHIYSQPRKGGHSILHRATWGCTREQSKPRTVGGRFCSIKRVWCPPCSHRRMCLACLNNSVGWQGTEIHYSVISRNCAWSPG